MASVKQGSFNSPKSLTFELEAYCVFCNIKVLLNEFPDCFHVKSLPKHLVEDESWLPLSESRAECMHRHERWLLQRWPLQSMEKLTLIFFLLLLFFCTQLGTYESNPVQLILNWKQIYEEKDAAFTYKLTHILHSLL